MTFNPILLITRKIYLFSYFIQAALDKSSSIIALTKADFSFIIEYYFHPTVH